MNNPLVNWRRVILNINILTSFAPSLALNMKRHRPLPDNLFRCIVPLGFYWNSVWTGSRKPMLTALWPGWNSRNWNEVYIHESEKRTIIDEFKNEQHYQKQIQRKIWKMKALLLSYQFMLSKYESSFWLKWNGYETR